MASIQQNGNLLPGGIQDVYLDHNPSIKLMGRTGEAGDMGADDYFHFVQQPLVIGANAPFQKF